MNDFEDIFKLNVFNDCIPDFESVWNMIITSNKEIKISKVNNEPFIE